MAVRGGGPQVLPLEELFQGISNDPLAPKYWWLYALLLSTMIPSLVNLVIRGSVADARVFRDLSLYLYRLMDLPSESDFHRVQIAALLAGQVVIGVSLGIAAQAAFIFVIFRYAMPMLGLEMLEGVAFRRWLEPAFLPAWSILSHAQASCQSAGCRNRHSL